MKAMAVFERAPIESGPLRPTEMEVPEPGTGEILVRVRMCGVCRTDLHVTEGDLPPLLTPVVPGHEVVGVVDRAGPGTRRFAANERVGVAWLHATCGQCKWCRQGRENLCPQASFTGYDRHGGYAQWMLAREDFAYHVPQQLDDAHLAPLLCAGIIGFRAIRRACVRPGSTVGLYGFGGSAHIAMQVLGHWGCRVFVMSRGGRHREHAESLGAAWIGSASEQPPAPLDSAILFAPAGELVPAALEALDRGGVLAIAGIHLSGIPALDYRSHLFEERELRSVTAYTREDAEDFLRLAAEIPVRTDVTTLALEDANRALAMLKHDELKGAAVLQVN